MRIVCVIDDLGSGGAQRQLCTLAIRLKARGHDVRFIIYHEDRYFLPQLIDADIPCDIVSGLSYLRRAFVIRRKLLDWPPDVVVAFLESPSFFVEIAGIFGRRWRLLVGERSANPSIGKGARRWMRQFHRLADGIVCNSHTNRLMLESAYPFLASKTVTVYNAVDLERFCPSSVTVLDRKLVREEDPTSAVFRIVVAASYRKNKNMLNLARALLDLKQNRVHVPIAVDWYGSIVEPAAYSEVVDYISIHGLDEILNLHKVAQNIEVELASADAVGLFSFYEGLPNAVCEAMACAKPILMSDVCDASNLVTDGLNGFLCDPKSPKSIKDAILKLVSLDSSELAKMRRESRKVAEMLLDEEEIVGRYESILETLVGGGSLCQNYSWPARVPKSALRTIDVWKD